MTEYGVIRAAPIGLFPEPITQVLLGMPHLGAHGLHFGWLLREACHIHWGSIAETLDMPVTEWRDQSGARVLASVVACTVNGDGTQFRENDLCQVFLTERPTAANGWRSQVDLRRTDSHTVRAEIITSFACRNGPSNCNLRAADLDPSFKADRDGPDARRTNVIRRLGAADRVQASHDEDPPHKCELVRPRQHINGVGLVYFAEMHDAIAQAEWEALPKLAEVWPLRNRRVHFFGNLDAGDRMEITARASAQAIAPDPVVVVRSHIKRGSDGAVIAVAESILGCGTHVGP